MNEPRPEGVIEDGVEQPHEIVVDGGTALRTFDSESQKVRRDGIWA